MDPIRTHSGIAAPLPVSDINTDVIFPQRYLRKPDRTAMAPYLFRDLRFLPDGSANPDFILNRQPYDSATILIAGPNFGSGSSREHAPWALRGFGFRALISSGFADIFRANCINNGIIPAILPEADVRRCLAAAKNPQEARFSVDLDTREISHVRLGTLNFTITDSDRDRLLRGTDLVDESLENLTDIEAHGQRSGAAMPWLNLGGARA
jgi:3-isopropylmalate/(R)-2-methylmalate dehydratase small subunit